MTELFPLIHQSLSWFRLKSEMSFFFLGVKLSSLEIGLPSSDKVVEMEIDIVSSKPSSSSQPQILQALKETCSLKERHIVRFRKWFQFLNEIIVYFPCKNEKANTFADGEVCFYEASFLNSLKFLVHPFIMELFHHLKIAPGQLVPNSWRIIITCMEIWMFIHEGDIIRVDEFVHLYHLIESNQLGYYQLVSWEQKARIMGDFPSSFWNWKSMYFFVSSSS